MKIEKESQQQEDGWPRDTRNNLQLAMGLHTRRSPTDVWAAVVDVEKLVELSSLSPSLSSAAFLLEF